MAEDSVVTLFAGPRADGKDRRVLEAAAAFVRPRGSVTVAVIAPTRARLDDVSEAIPGALHFTSRTYRQLRSIDCDAVVMINAEHLAADVFIVAVMAVRQRAGHVFISAGPPSNAGGAWVVKLAAEPSGTVAQVEA